MKASVLLFFLIIGFTAVGQLDQVKKKYDHFRNESNGYVVLQKGIKYGLCDSSGQILLGANYDRLVDYYPLYLTVKNNVQRIYHVKTDEFIRFDSLKHSIAGHFFIKNKGEWGALSNTGQKIIPCEYEAISDFYKGNIIVKKEGLYGFRKGNGEEILPPIYEFPRIAKVNKARKKNEWFRIDLLVDPHYFQGIHAQLYETNLINQDSKLFIDPNDSLINAYYINDSIIRGVTLREYDCILYNIRNELIFSRASTKTYDRDPVGQYVVVRDVANKVSNYNLVDVKGNLLFNEPILYRPTELINADTIKIYNNNGLNGLNLFGAVNSKGKVIIEPKFTQLTFSKDGTVKAQIYKVGEKGARGTKTYGYLDRNGKFIITKGPVVYP